MTWLRIDDSMPVNGKLGDLSDAEFRSLIALWAFCARKNNDGQFRSEELRHAIYTTPRGPRFVRPQHLERFIEVGLVHVEDGVFLVNDWSFYQPKDPTSAERKRRWRDRHE